jgi:hypothetical protein
MFQLRNFKLTVLLCGVCGVCGTLLIQRGSTSDVSGGTVVPVAITESDGGHTRQGVFFEPYLNPSNVSAATIGKLATFTADGLQIVSQPIFVPGVSVSGGVKDLILIDTMGNSVFAFDANAVSSTPVWSTNFGANYANYPGHGNPQTDPTYNQPIGCMSTPAADVALGVVFAVCDNASGILTIRKLSLTTGAVLASQTVTGAVTGTGDPQGGDMVSGGVLSFYSSQQLQRSSLAISNGKVYFSVSSFGDIHPWHGWVFAYNESNLTRAAVYCTVPNGAGGGVWMGGGAPGIDSAGNLYIVTGNGDWDGVANFGESIVKLDSNLNVLDFFTPADWAALESGDLDLSSTRSMLFQGLAVFGAKDYREYVINVNCMGHLQGSPGSCTQQLWTVSGSGHFGIFGGVIFNNAAYLPVNSGPVSLFPFTSGAFATSPTVTTSSSFGHPGAMMSVSWNGVPSSGVIWSMTCVNPSNATAQPGILRAFNAATLTELYNSTQNAGDTLGTLAKLSYPLVTNGRVFVPTGDGTIAVYGLK